MAIGTLTKRLPSGLLACATIGITHVAHANVNSAGVLDQALNRYRSAAEHWQGAAQGAATTLFWSLATVSLVWTMGQLVLRRAELGEFFGELVRFLLFTGFWAWMLANGPAHARLIMESMVRLGGDATGSTVASPSGVVDVGFQLLDRALKQSTITSPLDSAFGIVLALVILIVLALVAVNMLVTLTACWIVAYGGLIVLGFGASRWTSEMAFNYYRMVLSLALQVMAMVLLVGVGESFVHGYYDALEQDVSLHEQAVLLVVSIVLLALVNRIPPLLGSLANGSSPHALGMGAGAGGAMTTASTAGALAALSVRPALAGAGQIAKAAAFGALGSAAAAASLLDAFRSREGEQSTDPKTGSVSPPWSAADSERQSVSATPTPTHDEGPQEVHDSASQRTNADTFAGLRNDEDRTQNAVADQAAHNSPHGAADGAAQDVEADLPRELAAADVQRTEPSTGTRSDQQRGEAARLFSGAALEPKSSATASAFSAEDKTPAPVAKSSAGEFRAESTLSDHRTRSADVSAASELPAQRSITSTAAPTGTFASSGTNAPMTTANVPAPASAAPLPAGLAQQPSSPQSTATRVPTPSHALASAGARNTGIPEPQPFTGATPAESTAAAKTPHSTPHVEQLERRELHAAYSTQVEVDVEAEVAAFRDKDSE